MNISINLISEKENKIIQLPKNNLGVLNNFFIETFSGFIESKEQKYELQVRNVRVAVDTIMFLINSRNKKKISVNHMLESFIFMNKIGIVPNTSILKNLRYNSKDFKLLLYVAHVMCDNNVLTAICDSYKPSCKSIMLTKNVAAKILNHRRYFTIIQRQDDFLVINNLTNAIVLNRNGSVILAPCRNIFLTIYESKTIYKYELQNTDKCTKIANFQFDVTFVKYLSPDKLLLRNNSSRKFFVFDLIMNHVSKMISLSQHCQICSSLSHHVQKFCVTNSSIIYKVDCSHSCIRVWDIEKGTQYAVLGKRRGDVFASEDNIFFISRKEENYTRINCFDGRNFLKNLKISRSILGQSREIYDLSKNNRYLSLVTPKLYTLGRSMFDEATIIDTSKNKIILQVKCPDAIKCYFKTDSFIIIDKYNNITEHSLTKPRTSQNIYHGSEVVSKDRERISWIEVINNTNHLLTYAARRAEKIDELYSLMVSNLT